jgi:hypothetical protein
MQSKCPKCNGTAFRMLPETLEATEVECLTCGHVTPFHVTVTAPESPTTTTSKRRPAAE